MLGRRLYFKIKDISSSILLRAGAPLTGAPIDCLILCISRCFHTGAAAMPALP